VPPHPARRSLRDAVHAMSTSALMLDLSPAQEPTATLIPNEMLICPKCRTTYSSSLVDACYRDGEKLVDYDAFMVAENDPMRGILIGGKYRIAQRVGQGGMGTVYRAAQSGLNRDVAVKILKRELNVDRDTVARFHREANAMSLLAHPNTVRVFDFGQTDDGLLYLVMELLEGELITQRLSREGALDVLEAVRFAQQILRSLAEAHKKALVHRDLKPDNIFVATLDGHTEPVIKVLDFGIAKVVAPDRRVDQFETQAGTVFGTPRYMSPEQAQGASLDGRSDLYSVGTLLYQMLTGRAPFVDDDAVVVMAKHIREAPDPPRDAAPDRPIPESLERVVLRALAKEPGARFQDASEFEAALEACVADVISARDRPRVSVIASMRPKATRSTWLALLAAALVMLAYASSHLLAADETPGRPVVIDEPKTPAEITPPTHAEPVPPQEIAAPEKPARTEAARVSLRSEPNGASIFRDGKRVGNTPYELMVEPEEELVRVELRAVGYLPLAAELTAAEGERLIKLSPRRRGPASGQRNAKTPSDGTRNKNEPRGPYERFE